MFLWKCSIFFFFLHLLISCKWPKVDVYTSPVLLLDMMSLEPSTQTTAGTQHRGQEWPHATKKNYTLLLLSFILAIFYTRAAVLII